MKNKKQEWEIKKLEEVADEIFAGKWDPSDKNRKDGLFPAVKRANISGVECNYFSETNHLPLISFKNTEFLFNCNDILVIWQSQSKKIIGKSVLYLGNKSCVASTGIYVIRHSQNPWYLMYCLNSWKCKKQMEFATEKRFSPGGGRWFDLKDMKKVKLSLPPLQIQNLIGNYLYRLSLLEGQLKGSWRAVEGQKLKQFHYYSETLLIKKNKAKVVELGSVATEIYSGRGATKIQLINGNYPAIRYADIYSLGKYFFETKTLVDKSLIKNQRFCKQGDILFANVSENLRDVGKCSAYLGKNSCLIGDAVTVVKHFQNSKYLSFVLSTNFCKNKIKKLSKGVVTFSIYSSGLKQIQIPLPSLEEQQQIVNKLDVFYECVESLKTKIPELLELNKQRLQYYINKLTSC